MTLRRDMKESQPHLGPVSHRNFDIDFISISTFEITAKKTSSQIPTSLNIFKFTDSYVIRTSEYHLHAAIMDAADVTPLVTL